jgi:hypothetical protein
MQNLAGRPEGKREFGRTRYRSEDYIEVNLEEVVCDSSG